MAEKKTAAPSGTQAPVEDDGLVEVELFKDNGKYKDDVYVAVNGNGMLIKRGVRVRIPKAYAAVLDNAERQRMVANRTIEQLRDKSQR